MKRILIFILILCASVAFAALGPELHPNPDLTGTSGIFDGVGSGSGDVADYYGIFIPASTTVTAVNDGSGPQSISVTGSGNAISFRALSNKNTITSGTTYYAVIEVSALSGSVTWQVSQTGSVNVQFTQTISSIGTYTAEFVSDATFQATHYIIGLGTGESITIDLMSLKESTPETRVETYSPVLRFFNFFN